MGNFENLQELTLFFTKKYYLWFWECVANALKSVRSKFDKKKLKTRDFISKTVFKIFDFFDIKKSPVYLNEDFDDSDELKSYIVLDNIFFIEKMYSLFVNDFWFDYLKPNEICNRTDWGNFIGATFFEPFLEDIFYHILQGQSHYVYRSTDNLKVSLNGVMSNAHASL